MNAAADGKLLSSLINRLGEQVAADQNDALVQQNVNALVRLSERNVDVAMAGLVGLMEKLARTGAETSSAAMRPQSFLLRVMVQCLERSHATYVRPLPPAPLF